MDIVGLSTHAAGWQLVLLGAVSLGVGVLGGFVGLALGTMRLPALLLLGIPAPVAAGTNILVSTASAATGALPHLRGRRVDWRVVGIMGVPSVGGAFLGGLFADRVPEGLLVGAVGAFVLWQGVDFLRWARRGGTGVGAGAVRLTPDRVLAEGGIGFGIGLVGGAVGLILGTMRLPALVRFLRMDPRIAAGTNLTIGFMLGVAGFAGHGVRGDVDVPVLVVMAVTAMAGSVYGARLTGRVAAESILRVMGAVLLSVGVLLLWRAATV